MESGTRIDRSWRAFLVAAVLVLVFGMGQVFEPGPPYDDPLGGPDAIFEYAQIAIVPFGLLLVLGLKGFHPFYRHQLDRLGRLGWGAMFTGSLAMTIGGLVYIPSRSSIFWEITLLGNFVVAFGMVFLGISALRGQFLTQWRWSAFVVGLTYTVIFIAGSMVPTYDASISIGFLVFAITCIGWILFGTALRVNAKEKLQASMEG